MSLIVNKFLEKNAKEKKRKEKRKQKKRKNVVIIHAHGMIDRYISVLSKSISCT